jgi:hypothetical protein
MPEYSLYAITDVERQYRGPRKVIQCANDEAAIKAAEMSFGGKPFGPFVGSSGYEQAAIYWGRRQWMADNSQTMKMFIAALDFPARIIPTFNGVERGGALLICQHGHPEGCRNQGALLEL